MRSRKWRQQENLNMPKKFCCSKSSSLCLKKLVQQLHPTAAFKHFKNMLPFSTQRPSFVTPVAVRKTYLRWRDLFNKDWNRWLRRSRVVLKSLWAFMRETLCGSWRMRWRWSEEVKWAPVVRISDNIFRQMGLDFPLITCSICRN